MAYRFEVGESSSDALRRIAREELDGAVGLLARTEGSLNERIHETRKHLKKMRALLALSEGAAPSKSLDRETKSLRRAAHALARLRGEAALLECFENLTSAFPDDLHPTLVSGLHQRLTARNYAHDASAEEIQVACDLVTLARERLDDVDFGGTGWGALARGFRHTYAKARRAHRRALRHPTGETLHAFRTPAKRHFYHVQLLEPLWPEMLHGHRKALSHLGDLLGDHHDLSLLGPELAGRGTTPPELAALTPLIERRCRALETEVFDLAARLFAERPRAITDRFGAYFERAQRGEEKRVDAPEASP